jgi:electron transfer flavoprotein alpha subunit
MKILAYIPDEDWIEQILGAVEDIEGELTAFVLNEKLAETAVKRFDKVYLAKIERFELNTVREAVKQVLKEYNPDILLAPSTNKGRAVAGTFMGLTDAAGVSDVIRIELEGESMVLERLVYGGTAKARLKMHPPLSICISPGYFKMENVLDKPGEVIEVNVSMPDVETVFKPREVSENDPTKADVVVAAGRGVKDEKDMEMIKELAKALGGAWSVTRPLAADYGWADSWIGISGIVVSPKIYIAVGISGQPHHMMGARNSKIIISINKDPNAPIFEETDYGIVGDLYKVIPKILEKLREG